MGVAWQKGRGTGFAALDGRPPTDSLARSGMTL